MGQRGTMRKYAVMPDVSTDPGAARDQEKVETPMTMMKASEGIFAPDLIADPAEEQRADRLDHEARGEGEHGEGGCATVRGSR